MKFDTQDFHGTPPGTNLTGLTHTYADKIACMHMNLNTQYFHGDLSGFIFYLPPHLYWLNRLHGHEIRYARLW